MEQYTDSSTEVTINVTPRNRANLRRLKTSSIQSFQRWEKENELLYAMIEDESTWLSDLFPNEFITPELFFYALEDGTILCLLANYIQNMAEKFSERSGTLVPGKKFTFHKSKKGIRESKLFHSRDNVEKFLSWCRLHSIPEAILFESNDVVLVEECRTGGREIVICLMEIARRFAGYEIHHLPQLINLEREIDQEEINDSGDSTAQPVELQTSSGENREDRSPIDSDSGVESVFDEGMETTTPQVMDYTDGNFKNDSNNMKDKQKDETKEQKAPPSLLESNCPKTELDEKVCKIAKDYNIKIVHRLKEGKYIILGKIMFVRMLNDHLLVRIGGGWDTLEHYIMTHTPKPSTGDSSNPTTQLSEPRSRKGSGVWSKLVDKVKKRDSQPSIPVSPVVISKTPRPDSSPASYKLRDRFKKKLSVEEKDGKDISEAIQKIESSLLQTASSSPSFTSKTFFQLKSRFDRGRKNSREHPPGKKLKRMEEVNVELNGDTKEKMEQEQGGNDLLMAGNGETTTTTLIDFQESAFASSLNSNIAPVGDEPHPTTDELLFGVGQPSEQSYTYSSFQSSEMSSGTESGMVYSSTVLETEQSEVLRHSESETMIFSTSEEEKPFEGETSEEGGLTVETTEPQEPQPFDQGSADDHQLIDSQHFVMTERVETQPEEPQVSDTSMDNVEQITGDLGELQTPESEVHDIETERSAEVETQQETLVDVDAECSTEDETQPETLIDVDAERSTEDETQPETLIDVEAERSAEDETDPETLIDVEAERSAEVETHPETLVDAERSTEVETQPETLTVESERSADVETQPEVKVEPQPSELVRDDVESVEQINEPFTDQFEPQPAVPEQPETLETICKPDEHSLVESPPPLDEPQTQDTSVEDDVAKKQFTEQVESQPVAQEEPQIQDAGIDNLESIYKADEHSTEEVESAQPAALDEPQTQEHEPAAHEQPQAQEMTLLNAGDLDVTERTSAERVEVQPAVPVENGVTEAKPSEPEQETVESTSSDQQVEKSPEVGKEPSDIAPQVAAATAAAVPADSKPVESTVPQTATAKHKADAKSKTSKTTSSASKTTSTAKQTKPQSTSRPQSSRASKPKPATASSTASAATKKPPSAKTAPLKTAPAKPQGASKPASSKPGVTAKKPGAVSNKPAAANKPTTTRPASSKSAVASAKSKPPASKPATTSSRPATGTTKDKPTRPPSAPAANTKATAPKTRPQSAKPSAAKPTDKTNGKAANTLGKVGGKTTASGATKTTVKQTTVTSTQGPKTTTKTTRTATSKTTTKTPTQQPKAGGATKPGSATGTKPKAPGATRPKSPTKQPSKKSTTTKTEKKTADAAKSPTKAPETSPTEEVTTTSEVITTTPEEVTTKSEVTTTVVERTYTEDGDVTTVREVTETVSTNGEQQLINSE